ncbi:hypothetical protein MKX01_022845 [Papaver californicum]|nr:hypothetical protein MKX01_022845 [Papaver californicum]
MVPERPKFRSVWIQTQIHELPESFIKYVLDDSGSFLLPEFTVPEESEDQSKQPSPPPSPKDTAWISTSENLKRTSFSETALLLKSFGTLTCDLCHAFDSCDDKTSLRPSTLFIALRKWYHLSIQRWNWSPHSILFFSRRKKFLKFRSRYISWRMCKRCFESENYTSNMYVTKDGRIIIDFNPWGAFTLPLLLNWEELEMGLFCMITWIQAQVGWDQFLRNADEELRVQSKFPQAGA